jgi:ADP-ribose pyrophosphatase YjhB (NUDIX family)
MAESSGSTPTSHEALAVVLQVREGRLQVLLWQRAREPFNGAWALPGGLLGPSETLEASVRRHLAAKVDVRELAHLEQLETRSHPARHPGRMIATAYLGLVPIHHDRRCPPTRPGIRRMRCRSWRSTMV